MYSNNSHRIPTKVVSFIPAPIAVYSNKDFICDLRYVNDFLRVCHKEAVIKLQIYGCHVCTDITKLNWVPV